MNVLIVDDQAVNRKLLRVQLEAEELTVAEAANRELTHAFRAPCAWS